MTPYQRIMAASHAGKGIRLSADDVFRLSMDDAISTRAALDDEEGKPIQDIKPDPKRNVIQWFPPIKPEATP